ncbi:MAG TPA: ABC transporter ATP-binding protein [Chitinophagales bacterium]|nr:ABC transporter ATP-binding protein [Chitinophagales bacterium]
MQLQATQLSIGYGAAQVVFGDISFTAATGDMVALLGVNGIGKSTLLRTLTGLQRSVGGSVTVAGKELNSMPAQERARLISIVLTERLLVDNILVHEFIALGRMPYTNWLGQLTSTDQQEVAHIIGVMKLDKLKHKLFNELSDGEKQKVLIARALCQQTPVVILDEPTAFLDFRSKKEILELLAGVTRQLNKIVILSTHDVEAALQHCNKCWVMTEQKKFVEVAHSNNFTSEVMQLLF